MHWVWRRLAPYVRTTTTIELTGISEEQLRDIFRQEALRRLRWIETVIFNEEISDTDKVQVIQTAFLKD